MKTARSVFFLKTAPAGRRGFSLLEILVSLAVFSVVMVSAGGIFFIMYRDWTRQRDYLKCMQDVYWGIEFMSVEVRQAEAIDLQPPPSGGFPPQRLRPDMAVDEWVWYWRGNNNSDNEDQEHGFTGFIYRALTTRDIFRPGVLDTENRAYNRRRVLIRFIVNNPGEAFFYTAAGSLATLQFTLRPFPERDAALGNRDYRVRTVIRRRN